MKCPICHRQMQWVMNTLLCPICDWDIIFELRVYVKEDLDFIELIKRYENEIRRNK